MFLPLFSVKSPSHPNSLLFYFPISQFPSINLFYAPCSVGFGLDLTVVNPGLQIPDTEPFFSHSAFRNPHSAIGRANLSMDDIIIHISRPDTEASLI